MPEVTFKSIGVVRTPFSEQAGTPIQPAFASDARGTIVIDAQYAPALKDLDGFERIWAICHLDRVGPYQPIVIPYLDDVPHGVFATRSPSRPNPIGLSVLRMLSIVENLIEVEGVDMLDGTPVLDLKPYIPAFDAVPVSRAGWFDTCSRGRRTADDRFAPPRQR